MSKRYLKIPLIEEIGYTSDEPGIKRTQVADTGYIHFEDTTVFVSKEFLDLAEKHFLVEEEITTDQVEPNLPPLMRVSTEDPMEDLRKTLLAIGEMSRGIRS